MLVTVMGDEETRNQEVYKMGKERWDPEMKNKKNLI